jgi:hypothetical protein
MFSSSSKLSLPQCKISVPLKHSAAGQSLFAVRLLDHLKRLDAAFTYFFWQKLMFSRSANYGILKFRRSQTAIFHNGDYISEYTVRMHVLTHDISSCWDERDERTRHHLLQLI